MASSEFGLGLGTQTAIDPQAQTRYMLEVAKSNIKRGAGWFDVIAGLSVVNAILAMMGGWRFLAGLGVTAVANEVGASFGKSGVVVGFVITLIAAGIFVLIGHFAKQGHFWAVILGITFYALDTLLVLAFMTQAWLVIAFHAYALFMISKTFSAIKLYQQAKTQAAAQGVVVT